MVAFPGWILIAVIVFGGIFTVVVIRRRANDQTPEDRSVLLLVTVRFLALLYAGLVTIFTVVSTILTLVNGTVRVNLPVGQFWPETYPWVDFSPKPSASVVNGGFTSADVLVEGLGIGTRLVLAAGGLVQGLVFVFIATVLALLCHRLLGGTPFRPLLARSTTWAAAAIGIGGIVWQILFGIGGSMASHQVLGIDQWTSYLPGTELPDYVASHFDPLATGLPGPSLGANVDVWPVLVGLALAAVAIAFRYIERLQKDVEGLV